MNAMMKTEAPGRVILDEAPTSYYVRRLDEASASGMKQILRSPAHFAYWCANPDDDKESAALTFGRAFHCAVLEPDVFASSYVVLPGDAPQKPTAAMLNAKKPSPESLQRQEWWREWGEANRGKCELKAADYDRAQRMADSVRAHPVAAGLLVGGEREVTFRWQDEQSGIACKARADLYLAGEYLMDLKSCRDASPEGFARAVASYLYDLQCQHYVNGIQSAGDAIRWFVFLAVESEAPYVCQPHILNAQAEERGWKLRCRALARQAECLKSGKWGGYSDALNELALPTYAYYGIEDNA